MDHSFVRTARQAALKHHGWQRGHHAVVRPPMVARRRIVPCRGHLPPARQRSCRSQPFGGSELSRPMVRSEARETKRTLRQSAPSFSALRAPALRRGAMCARQRISSAIQLPMPGKPPCMSNTALIGARACRPTKSLIAIRVNCRGIDFRCAGRPPVRRLFPVMKTNPAKLPRIAEDQRQLLLLEDKVVMFAGAKTGRPRCGDDRSSQGESRASFRPRK